MKRMMSRAASLPWFAAIRRHLPLAMLSILIVALAVPAAMLVAPSFAGFGPKPEATESAVPAWQQVPRDLSLPQGISPLKDSAPVPWPDTLAAQLNATLKTDGGGTFTGVVQDAATGQVLFDRGGADSRVPASNMKLLTAAAAVRALGPDHRFTTKVIAGTETGSVVLTGGGDVLLGAGESAPDNVMGHAGLATLAQLTIKSLQEKGIKGPVQVRLGDSLFTGPALNPTWSPDDVAAGETAPLFPLALNSARYDPSVTTGPRPQDAAMNAGEAFSAQLTAAGAAAGLTVTPGVVRGQAPQGADADAKPVTSKTAASKTADGDAADKDPTDGGAKADAADKAAAARPGQVLAEIQSATVRQQVDLMLQTSDNYLAEVLGRMAAVAAGQPGSNDGATATVYKQVQDLGISTDGLRVADVSGLSLGNQVSARQLSDVVRAITSGAEPSLRAVIGGFPVAGLTGTLGSRYTDASTEGGAGLVRAKTGTLNSVIALSGYVVDADGRLLVFSFIGNGLAPGAAGNKAALDRTATVLASCGCR
ncbi:D-alanyl-D-alanine carboxypeptidase/D-alanyl-D-alanine-endopeptidase [Arthrobacter oryzae]|uniref:D-alanyl-D-alanine carboxypeptidase/D-alanyl-D-alanine endopeptidase n=1 Tax=Arthrobacter oryzae TaxID=409290 RepID=UPI0028583A7C|nr:D-alanyl-D-alanine carboxypeptidase/D-alanyl-D-alanine-endopeptidase [Arthrobacter oryzae]MDR6504746.1 D-alanyl-D-alanine carboxypeptidase/D-alanyl-D-alanine-endopeptidase (penicillin-binding protein 4) [Arthrobacter oryzae]